MNKHTPGPWTLNISDFWSIDAATGDPLMGNVTHYPRVPDRIEDWRLIAAAPELYEAVKNCVTVLAHVSERMGMKVDHPFLEELRAVLAKVDA